MKNLTLERISKMDSPELSTVIEYWKDYNLKSVLLSYAELKKRDYDIPERLLKRQNEFCAKNNYDNIDTFLNDYLKENDNISNEESFVKEATPQREVETKKVLNNSVQSSENYYKYPALRTISAVYKVFAWVIGIVTLMIAIMALDKGDMGITISLISIVIGGLIVLGVLAVSESIKVFIDIEHNTRQKGIK
ncbi:MAG TPA: hypothetical protein VIN72_11420 [Lutibacter sp.]